MRIYFPMLAAAAFGACSAGAALCIRLRKERRARSGEPFERVPLEDMPPLRNDLLLRAARGEVTERAPVWIMRQAGRYLPEYRELRVMADFFGVCRTPELACEVTLQPLRRFPKLDASIIFSDILVVPQAMGLECVMVKGRGPVFPQPLEGPDDLARLTLRPNVEETLGYVFDAINLTRVRIGGAVPLIGFCGGPWTLMAYMIEGGGSKTFHRCKTWLYRHPEAAHRLLAAITAILVEYLVGQVAAGAQALQVFESWAGEVAPAEAREFVLPYLTKLAREVKRRAPAVVPMVVFPRNAHALLSPLADSEFDVIQIDWSIDLREALRIVGGRKAVQGNVDPAVLFGTADAIRRKVAENVRAAAGARGFIANLGHGVLPFHTPEQVGAYLDAVHEYSAAR